jgi:nicotinamidase-related amidase
VPGKPGFDIPDAVKLEPSDMRIVKTYGNSFNKTGLTEKLKELGVDTVIITGFCADNAYYPLIRARKMLTSNLSY